MLNLTNSEILATFTGAFLAALFASVAYFYKSSKDRKELINESLFHLLEVWRALFLLRELTSENYFKEIIKALRKHYPGEHIPDELADKYVHDASKMMPKILLKNENIELSAMYSESVLKLSKALPFLAYSLNGNSFLIQHIHRLDSVVSPEEAESFFDLLSHMKSVSYRESIDSFEDDLRRLSWMSGVRNWVRVRREISRFHKKSALGIGSVAQEYVSTFVVPFIDKQIRLNALKE